MEDWGKMLLKYYNKDLVHRYNDFTINYLSYWTDNGIFIKYILVLLKDTKKWIFDFIEY